MKTTSHSAKSPCCCGGSPEDISSTTSAAPGGVKDGILDVRELPPALRHSLIFKSYDDLGVGEAFVLVNDHDPKPLFYQFTYEMPGKFSWVYEEQGPQTWRVRIGKTQPIANSQ